MMIRGPPSCYPNGPVYGDSAHEVISSSVDEHSNPTSFLYNLSVLKHKFNEIQFLSSIFLSSDHGQHPESTAIATMGTLIQEIIVTASSMMFACQQMSLSSSPANYNAAAGGGPPVVVDRGPSYLFSANHHDNWLGDSSNNCNSSNDHNYNHRTGKNNGVDSCTQGVCKKELPQTTEIDDVVELDAADILAKYTHYCQICSKGFKRDANLRMHMRAHGEEYKSSAALSNPMRDMKGERRKYSCPQEGCRWNKHHAKFQPLKSMICVKNHYKRSHCPKMYICKRCNRKQFSVLSDLRTHEKHCGDAKWLCSCGTTFSRKDKLMGHVALFAGHTPAVNLSMKMGTGGTNASG